MSAEWQFLIALDEQLRPLRDPVQTQEATLRLLCNHLGDCRVIYIVIEGDEFIVTRSSASDVPAAITRGPLTLFGKAMSDASQRGETIVVHDVMTDARLGDADRELIRAGSAAAFVGVPLIKNGRWVAMLGVQGLTPRQWSADQVQVIRFASERMWNAAERARAEEALGKSESRQAFLRRLNEHIRPLAVPARVLYETCRLLALHLGVNRVSYGEIEGDECHIVGEYSYGMPSPPRFPWQALGESQAADIRLGRTLVVNDTAASMHTPEETAALLRFGVGAYLCPLIVKDHRFIGTLGIHNREPRTWTPDDIALAEEVADRLWTTLEHRRAEASLRENEDRLAFLLRLNDALRPLTDPGAVQHTAATMLGDHLGVSRVAYAEYDGDDSYVIRREHARGVRELSASPHKVIVRGAIAEALRKSDPVVVTSIETDPRLTEAERIRYREMEVAAFVSVTLFKDGQRVAGFGATHRLPCQWAQREINLIREVAERTFDAVERARAESELREQDQRLRLALDASEGGAWSWIADTGHLDWDDRFRALYGIPLDEPARREAWLPRVHAEDQPRMLAAMMEIMEPAAKSSWEYIFRIVRPDGTVGWIQSRGRADRDADGRVLRLTGLDLDFDRRRRLEEAAQAQRDEAHNVALQARAVELEHRTRQLSLLASSVTLAEQRAREDIARTLHDGLQQLLVIASSNLDRQLQRDAERGAPPNELLSAARGDLAEAIAAARSLSMELYPPVLQRSGLPAAFEWLARWMHEKHQLDVDITVDARADSARKDVRTLLFESVRELLFNAVKHAHVTRVRLELAINAQDQLSITVSDNGVGFDPSTLDDHSTSQQRGWGLFSIRERLTLFGGDFDLDSAPGGGTRIRLIAPRDTAPSATRTDVVAGAANFVGAIEVATATAADALTILVVDDHVNMRRSIREVLDERPQLSVIGEAANGIEAIKCARALRPDVILMDVAMPQMDGIEATSRIHAELPDIEILGLSMHSRGEVGDAIERAGAAGYFVKGTDTRQLVDHLLRLHASRRTRE